MGNPNVIYAGETGRSPYGERGLKLQHRAEFAAQLRRSPYGERGLKFSQIADDLTGQVALLTESVD